MRYNKNTLHISPSHSFIVFQVQGKDGMCGKMDGHKVRAFKYTGRQSTHMAYASFQGTFVQYLARIRAARSVYNIDQKFSKSFRHAVSKVNNALIVPILKPFGRFPVRDLSRAQCRTTNSVLPEFLGNIFCPLRHPGLTLFVLLRDRVGKVGVDGCPDSWYVSSMTPNG